MGYRVAERSGSGIGFGEKTTDLVAVVPIIESHLDAVAQRWREAAKAGADMIEWRLDFLDPTQRDAGEIHKLAQRLRADFSLPVLATWRTEAEGGRFPLDSGGEAYADAVRSVLDWADLVDVEFCREEAKALIAQAAETTAVVASFHDFAGSVEQIELREYLLQMDATEASVIKVAVNMTSEEDLERLLDLQDWAHSLSKPSVVIGMGSRGKQTRLGDRARRSAFAFAIVDADVAEGAGQGRSLASAPGQPTLRELRDSVI